MKNKIYYVDQFLRGTQLWRVKAKTKIEAIRKVRGRDEK